VKSTILIVNYNELSPTNYTLKDKRTFEYVKAYLQKIREIFDKRGVFKCEHVLTIQYNSPSFQQGAKGLAFVSGSTYVKDGREEMFEKGILELEKILSDFDTDELRSSVQLIED